jgi:hypothetical protein
MAKKKKPKVELKFASWIDDPDEPDDMTDEDIERMVKGVGKLINKPDQKKNPR